MDPDDGRPWTRSVADHDTVYTLPRSTPAAGAGAVLFVWAVGCGLLFLVPVGPVAAFAPALAIGGVMLIPVAGVLVACGAFAALGLWVALARDQIRVGGDELIYRRGVGLFWKGGAVMRISRVRRFVVTGANSRSGANAAWLWGELSVLQVEDMIGRRRQLGLWYERELLLGLAAELADRNRSHPGGSALIRPGDSGHPRA
jgi:hypothetical protein